MAERIIIADLQIEGIEDLIQETGDLTARQRELRDENRQLARETNNLSEATDAQRRTFVQNNAQARVLGRQITVNNRAIEAQTSVTTDLNAALNRQRNTEAELRASNSELIAIRRNVNIETEEGRETVARINEELDENNRRIRENVSQYEQQRINIGNYTQSIRDALAELRDNQIQLTRQRDALIELREEVERGSEEWNFYSNQIDDLDGQLDNLASSLGEVNSEQATTSVGSQIASRDFIGLAQSAQEAGGASALLSSVLRGVRASIIAVTQASLAFLATPIGAVLGLIGAAFLLVQNAMNRSEEATNRIRRAFSGLTGIFNGFLRILEPVGEFLIDGVVFALEEMVDIAIEASQVITDLQARFLRFIGLDDAADTLENLNQSIVDAVEGARQLADAEAQLETAQRNAQRAQLDFQRQAEVLRQRRDDEQASIEDRIRSNDELGVVLQRQLAAELAIAQQALDVANIRLEVEGQSSEALDAQAEALTEIADIQERITGQQSEQLTNRVALEREAADLARERLDIEIARLTQELELFRLQNQNINNSLTERIRIEQEAAQRSLEILREQLRNSNITREEFAVQSLQIERDLAASLAEITVENLQNELELFEAQNQSRLEQGERLTDLLVEQELERQARIFEAQQEILETQRETGLISEQEFLTQRAELENNFLEQQAEIRRDFDEQEREEQLELRALRFEEDLQLAEERRFTEFEIQQAQIEEQRQLDIAEAQRTIQNEQILAQTLTNINREAAQAQADVDAALQQSKIQGRLQVLNAIGQIAGQESTIGKAAAIAETTIQTYLSAQKAFSSLASIPVIGPALGAVAAAAAIASGLANVARIVGINVGSNVSSGLSGISAGVQTIGGTLPRGEKGLTIRGRRHSQGGETIFDRFRRPIANLEDGENMYVLNRSASRLINALSDVNVMTGGVPLSTMTTFAQDGGQVSRTLADTTGGIRQVQQLIEDNISNIRVINDPNETLREGMDVISVENEANI